MSRSDDKDKPTYTIREAAKMLDVSDHTLRLYEREGLIAPYKKESSHRLYSESDIERLKSIRDAIVVRKMNIAGIRALYSLIPCWDIVKCSDEERSRCSAYQKNFMPCWTYDHDDNVCSDRACRLCPVYKEYSDYDKLKDWAKTR